MKFRNALLICAHISLIAGIAHAQDVNLNRQSMPAQLVFHVTGQAEAMPETVLLHFTIVGDGETLAKAQEQLNQTQQAILSTLEKFDIKAEQMKTDRFSLTPLQATLGSLQMESNPTTLPALGYRAQRDCTIMPAMNMESLEKLIRIADALLQQGARPVSLSSDALRDADSYGNCQPGVLLEFSVRDPENLLKDAVNNAITRARGLAEEVSKQMDNHTLSLATVQVGDSGCSSQSYYGITGVANNITGSTFAKQPIRVMVNAEVGFTYK